MARGGGLLDQISLGLLMSIVSYVMFAVTLYLIITNRRPTIVWILFGVSAAIIFLPMLALMLFGVSLRLFA